NSRTRRSTRLGQASATLRTPRPHGEIRRGRTATLCHSNRPNRERADGSSWRPSTTRLATMWKIAEQLLADVASKIETVGVPATINDLLLAGIRIWVLTGDKLETAINIGYSCRLLQSGMEVRTLTGSGLDDSPLCMSWVGGLEGSSKEPALVVEGEALAWAGRPELRAEFLEVCLQCRTVICCRVSPKQKSDVVRYVREALPTAVTLAIGDGANDVPMISGEPRRGRAERARRACRPRSAASDYALAQFRFLKKLLFVHVILFSFYKNLTLYITSFWFAMASGFSGQENCMRYPQLYKENQGSGSATISRCSRCGCLMVVYHSAHHICCVGPGSWHGSVFPKRPGVRSVLTWAGTVYSLAVRGHTTSGSWPCRQSLNPHVGSNFAEVWDSTGPLFGSANFWLRSVGCWRRCCPMTQRLGLDCLPGGPCAKTLRERSWKMEKLQRDPVQGVLLRNLLNKR
uniref:PhoLip_ATPase_C domain-containing protein n=1 Tax=Macrostomum lignano TaxID=282301 RepID=A0A1I8F8D9_9PLAT